MQSTTDRRLEIIEYLCQVRSTTRTELAARFGVHKNTIDNDLLALTCSYPIFTKQGNGGCIYIEDGYYLHKKYLTKSQQELLEKLKLSIGTEDAETLESIIQQFGRR